MFTEREAIGTSSSNHPAAHDKRFVANDQNCITPIWLALLTALLFAVAIASLPLLAPLVFVVHGIAGLTRP